jgi:hypothetical protein
MRFSFITCFGFYIMAIVDQITFSMTRTAAADLYAVRLCYQMSFSKCEVLAQFVYLEQAILCRMEATGDQILGTLYKNCVRTQNDPILRELALSLPLNEWLQSGVPDASPVIVEEKNALYVRVTLVPYLPQECQSLSNLVYL